MESKFFDGTKQLTGDLQYYVASNWKRHSVLKELGDSWEYEIPEIGLTVYLKNTSLGLSVTSYAESDGLILKDKKEFDFKETSYKQVYHACYFFDKFPVKDIKDVEDY